VEHQLGKLTKITETWASPLLQQYSQRIYMAAARLFIFFGTVLRKSSLHSDLLSSKASWGYPATYNHNVM